MASGLAQSAGSSAGTFGRWLVMRNGKCDGVNSMKSSTLVVGPRVPVPIAFAASAHRGSLRNHPAEPLPQNEHPVTTCASTRPGSDTPIPRELSGSMSTSCGRPPLVSRTASQGRSSGLPLASLLARAAVLARSVSKSARNQLWGRRNPRAKALTCGFVVARGGVEPPTFRFSVGRSYQLSYLALQKLSATGKKSATPTGLEPATSAVTGRRANQLRYGALGKALMRIPNGIRTRATAVKGRGPGPLDDGDPEMLTRAPRR